MARRASIELSSEPSSHALSDPSPDSPPFRSPVSMSPFPSSPVGTSPSQANTNFTDFSLLEAPADPLKQEPANDQQQPKHSKSVAADHVKASNPNASARHQQTLASPKLAPIQVNLGPKRLCGVRVLSSHWAHETCNTSRALACASCGASPAA